MQACRPAFWRSSPPCSPSSPSLQGARARPPTNPPPRNSPIAATLLTESSATTKAQTSAHLKLSVQGQIPELPVESLEGDLTQSPAVAAKGSADIVFLGQRLQGVEFVVSDGDLFAAITAGGGLSNFGPASDIYDVAAILNPDIGLANVLANFSDAKADGRETIDGAETVRITGNVTRGRGQQDRPADRRDRSGSGHRVDRRGRRPRTDAGHAWTPAPATACTMTLSEWGKPVTVTKPAV